LLPEPIEVSKQQLKRLFKLRELVKVSFPSRIWYVRFYKPQMERFHYVKAEGKPRAITVAGVLSGMRWKESLDPIDFISIHDFGMRIRTGIQWCVERNRGTFVKLPRA